MQEQHIPPSLFNEDSGQLHRECKICQKELLKGEVYGIQKVFKNYPDQEPQALFDFALCSQCMQEARQELSLESRERIDQFMMERVNELATKGIDVGTRFDHGLCALSGKALSATSEYQVVAVCKEGQLLESPLALSDDILEAIQDLLSKESKDTLDRFKETNFGWPPELKKLWQEGDFVLL